MDLTIREKIAQSVMVKADPELHKKKYGSIKAYLEKYPVGGIFVGGEIIKETKCDGQALKKIIEEYQSCSNIPLLVAADGESGLGHAVSSFVDLPPQMCLGATKSSELAYKYGSVCGRCGMEIGINMTFAPVSDLNINKHNLITNVRSITDDVNLGTKLLPHIIKGIQDCGMLATSKHFPGDGIDYRDQHIVGSKNSLSKEEWYKLSGAMFKCAIESDVAAIMAGHISLPAFQTAYNGNYAPATLSKELIVDLLKGELGFKGLVVTDALNMGGFGRWYYDPDEAEVKAYEFGNDMLLWPDEGVIDRILKCYEAGEIPESRINDAFSRVMAAKNRVGQSPYNNSDENRSFSVETAKELAEKGTCVIKNEINLLPLGKNVKKIKLICISPVDAMAEKLKKLKSELEKQGVSVDMSVNRDMYKDAFFEGVDRDYDVLIYALAADSRDPNFMGKAAVALLSSLLYDIDKTIIACFGSPYYCYEFFPTAHTYINSYFNDYAIESFAKGIFGKCELSGETPVKLN